MIAENKTFAHHDKVTASHNESSVDRVEKA
jgi:hypothetical protein